jgi:tetratricopeptide (TPR) repeat protein
MSFLKKILGKKSPPSAEKPPPPRPIEELRKDPNLFRVFDKYGQELFISKEQWRTSVLPGTIKSNWNNPDGLCSIILGSLKDGFRADVIPAAEHLYKTDPDHVRSACVWGIVLMEEGRIGEAEQVFQKHIATYGESGAIVTNLAKVFSKRNDKAKSEQTLWHALELDPNQDNALLWYQAIYRERGGDEAGDDALRRIAILPKSWRAQLWIARSCLHRRALEDALALYRQAIDAAGSPAPGDLLKQMSGDLGGAGHLPEILQLAEPAFDPALHGIEVGNNLIKAHVDLGQLDAAHGILNRLYALNRPDWKAQLQFWDTEIAKARIAGSPMVQNAPMEATLLTIEGPIWLPASSPVAEFFPAPDVEAPRVAFLGSSGERATNSKRAEHQLADRMGRLSRSLPLFLTEQAQFRCDTRALTLIPWLVKPEGAFVLNGVSPKDDEAASYATQHGLKNDYVVVTHLKTQTTPWIIEARIIRTIDAKCLETLTASLSPDDPGIEVPAFVQKVLDALRTHAELERGEETSPYEAPPAPHLSNYLLRLEQLLAVRAAGMESPSPGALSGEREIIDDNIQLCLACPESVAARLVLAQTVVAMKKARSDIMPEFKTKLESLQSEKTLPSAFQQAIIKMMK